MTTIATADTANAIATAIATATATAPATTTATATTFLESHIKVGDNLFKCN